MLKAYRYRLRPTPKQATLLEHHVGCSRYIYNWGLEIKNRRYAQDKTNLSRFAIQALLPKLKKENPWLKEVNSQSLQYSLKCLDTAFVNFFRKQSAFPNFKSKHKSRKSFGIPQNVKVEGKKLIIPKFKEGIRLRLSRKIDGEIRQATISKASTGKWFVSILVETGEKLPDKKELRERTTVGIDVGIKDFAILSNGQKITNPKFLRKQAKHLVYLQRQASKKKPRGKNRAKANQKVALCHEKITNSRRDFLHKLSSTIIREWDSVVVEDLAVSNLVKNHHLARAISECSWSEFFQMLQYKADWYGKNFIKIGRFEPSSKLCSVCGYKYQDLTLDIREWECPGCHTIHDRDINAAYNIKRYGLKTGWDTSCKALGAVEITRSDEQGIPSL